MSELKIITHVEGDDYGDEEVRYQEFFVNGATVVDQTVRED